MTLYIVYAKKRRVNDRHCFRELPQGCEGGNNRVFEDHLGVLLLKLVKSSGVVSDRKTKV